MSLLSTLTVPEIDGALDFTRLRSLKWMNFVLLEAVMVRDRNRKSVPRPLYSWSVTLLPLTALTHATWPPQPAVDQ